MTALVALNTARRAWERTQPQLFWTDESLWDGLEERRSGAAPLLEPVLDTHPPEVADGLASTFDGDGANHMQGARRPRKEVTP